MAVTVCAFPKELKMFVELHVPECTQLATLLPFCLTMRTGLRGS